MKKFLAVLCLVLLLVPTVIFATESYNDNIMAIDETVVVNGTANGLIMLCGNTISSNANGDYAFIVGREVNISGNITRDAFVVGETVTIENTGVINRDLYVCASKVIINGAVNRNIYVASSELLVGDKAYIMGDVHSATDKIVISETANVLGTVEYRSDASVVSIPDGIEVNRIEIETNKNQGNVSKSFDFNGKILELLMVFVTFILMLAVVPEFFTKIDERYALNAKELFKAFGIGVLLLIVVPIASIILMVTIVGLPIAVVALLMYIIAFIITGAVAGYTIVKAIFGSKVNKFVAGTAGVIAYKLLTCVPVLGGIIYFFCISLTLGVMYMTFKKNKNNNLSADNSVDENPKMIEAEEKVEANDDTTMTETEAIKEENTKIDEENREDNQ